MEAESMNENPDTQPADPALDNQFVALLTRHQGAMLAYIRSLAPYSPAADDVLQEVSMTVWEKRNTFELGSNFKAWAFQIIRYHMMNHRRKLAREGWLIFDDDLLEAASPELEASPEEISDRQEALRMCMARLRPKDRELLHQRYATDTTLAEYATATGRKPGTLKAILFGLRGALRKCIEGKLGQATA